MSSHPRFDEARPTPDSPFGRFFDQPRSAEARVDPLLRGTAARRWFDTLSWGVEEDLYTYLQAFDRTGDGGPRVEHAGWPMLMLSSYDYLGLRGHPRIEDAAIEAIRRYGTGTGGVRLLSGTVGLHRELEAVIAGFKGTEAAITFGSGYTANTAVLTTLLGPRDLLVADDRAHRSLIEGARAAGVPVRRFRHNDTESLRAALLERPRGRVLIVVDGIYSMDGDLCPLPEIVEIKRHHDAMLLVDEAHSLGVAGASGRGVHEHFGIPANAVDVWTGSLSKAIPSTGGFVAGSRSLIHLLQHAAAPFVFSAALAPASAAAALASIREIQHSPDRVALAWERARYLRAALGELGFDLRGTTPLIPVVVGEEKQAWSLSRELFSRGVVANAVTYPAVARGGAILRICATAGHTEGDLESAVDAFAGARAAWAPA